MGVTYWDTAEMYSGGKSEQAMGKFFARYYSDIGTRLLRRMCKCV